ncbi:MAG: DUF484 family protein [Alphaproteobacteria bacterium]|nr:DUF484 family protein [Alphaproteobacteria bacterium]
MVSDSKNAPTARAASVARSAAVKAYLEKHPTFLVDHPELVQSLAAPVTSCGDNVLDMQRFMVERLQHEVRRLKSLQDELVKVGESNLASQTQVHDAILALLEARTLEHQIEIATNDFTRHLAVDAICIAIEASVPGKRGRGVRIIEIGTVNRLLGESAIILREDVEAEGMLYGKAAKAIRSDALLRLTLGPLGPHGLLALGARDKRRFQPDQGTELLSFLGHVVTRSLKTWLDLPG